MAMMVVKAAREAADKATGVLGALTPRSQADTAESSLSDQTAAYATFAEPSQPAQMSAIFISHLAKGILVSGGGDQHTREGLAALVIQMRLRARKARAKYTKQFHKVNLMYEAKILETRGKRRGLLLGMANHAMYLTLLLVILLCQEGSNVTNRYSVTQTLQDYVLNVEGDSGNFEDIKTMDDFGQWMQTGFLAGFDFTGNRLDGVVWKMKTYNSIRGALRVEVERINDNCPWKTGDWKPPGAGENGTTKFYNFRLPESTDGCYADLTDDSATDEPYGPWWDPQRFRPLGERAIKGAEKRFAFDIVVGKTGLLGFNELLADGFLDESLTRVVRVRLLTYNNALPMLCALSIQASLSSTGVLEPSFSARAIPVQEYLPRSLFVLAFEVIFLLWTAAQILGEFAEVASIIKEVYGDSDQSKNVIYAVCGSYFGNLFNVLDWTRFALIIIAVYMRVQIFQDTSRDFDPLTTFFIDTERIVDLFVAYDITASLVMVLSVMSAVQYFDLLPPMAILKRTLAVCIVQLGPFMFVFLFFFLFYALIGSLLVGSELEEWSTFERSVFTTFEMMNANYPFDAFLPALANGGGLKMAVMMFFFISFIMLHYFMLLNVIIAIVVEAYLDVRKTADLITTVLLNQNTDSLSNDVLGMLKSNLSFFYYVGLKFLYPSRFEHEAKTAFVPWSDAEWYGVLREVMKYRYESGREIKQVSLCELAYDITKLEGSYRISYLQGILSKKADVSFRVSTFFNAGPEESSKGLNARDVALGADPEKRRPLYRGTSTSGSKPMASYKAKGMNALDGPEKNQDAAIFFRQCLARFYERSYFEAPPNLREPLDETAQPSASTWLDRVLHRLEDKVANIDEFVNASKEETRTRNRNQANPDMASTSAPPSWTRTSGRGDYTSGRGDCTSGRGEMSEASKDQMLVECTKALTDVRKALEEQKRLHRETLHALNNGAGVASSSRPTNGSPSSHVMGDLNKRARRIKSMVLVSKTTGERRTVPVPTGTRADNDIGTRLYNDLHHRTRGSASARNGANGTNGTNGANGANGTNGTNGTNGDPRKHGKSFA